jgi:hypothetical protein
MSDSARHFNPHGRFMLALLLVLSGPGFLGSGCGKKGPPRPPRHPLPPVVKDLGYTLHDHIVELSWTIPEAAGHKTASPAVAKVYRSRLSAEELGCENCPIHYTILAEIPTLKQPSGRSPFQLSYSEAVEPGYRYFYKVTLFDESGVGGKDSNVVQFDYPSN